MHGAGLSVGISCQRSTTKPRASSYITKRKKNLCQRQAEVKQELLQHSNPFCTDGINSCLSYCASSRMCSCWYGGFICGTFCQLRWESIQAYADTMRTADAWDVLYERRLSSWAFTKMALPPLFFNCALTLSSKRLNARGTFELNEPDVVETEHLFAIFPLTGHIPQVQFQQGSIFRWLPRWHMTDSEVWWHDPNSPTSPQPTGRAQAAPTNSSDRSLIG